MHRHTSLSHLTCWLNACSQQPLFTRMWAFGLWGMLVLLVNLQAQVMCAGFVDQQHSSLTILHARCCAGYLHDNRKAQKAAYRRAADLLQACGAARRRSEGAAAADGAYEGALGLTRKLHYTGYVQVCVRAAAPQACWPLFSSY